MLNQTKLIAHGQDQKSISINSQITEDKFQLTIDEIHSIQITYQNTVSTYHSQNEK